MKDEDKAKELADCCPGCTFSCGDRLNCKTESVYNVLLEMARWKDEQYKEQSKYYVSIPKAEYEELLYFKEHFLETVKNSNDKPTMKG